MLEQNVKFLLFFAFPTSLLPRSLQEVHCLDDTRVVKHPLHLKFFEHVREFFLRQFVIVEHLALFDNASHGRQYVWRVNLTKVDIALTALANLTLVVDVELLRRSVS